MHIDHDVSLELRGLKGTGVTLDYEVCSGDESGIKNGNSKQLQELGKTQILVFVCALETNQSKTKSNEIK